MPEPDPEVQLVPSKWLSSTVTWSDSYTDTMSSVSPPLPLLWSTEPDRHVVELHEVRDVAPVRGWAGPVMLLYRRIDDPDVRELRA